MISGGGRYIELREQLVPGKAGTCFETVFSHTSKIDFLGMAKARGYQIILCTSTSKAGPEPRPGSPSVEKGAQCARGEGDQPGFPGRWPM